jgi:hypothetical protein
MYNRNMKILNYYKQLFERLFHKIASLVDNKTYSQLIKISHVAFLVSIAFWIFNGFTDDPTANGVLLAVQLIALAVQIIFAVLALTHDRE